MSFTVKFTKTGEVKEICETLEQARGVALAMSRWNHGMTVVDSDTLEVVQEFEPYRRE